MTDEPSADELFRESLFTEPFDLNKPIPQEDVIALERYRAVAQRAVSDRLREDAVYQETYEQVISALLQTLSAEVLRERVVEKTHSASVTATATATATAKAASTRPMTWWDHWKWECAPYWFRKKWPPRFHSDIVTSTVTNHARSTEVVSVTFEQYASFPLASIRTPEKVRGPILVRTETLDLTDWPKENT